MWGVMLTSYVLMTISFVSLIFAAYVGYFPDMIENHILFSLFSSIIYMLCQTLILFYFIVSGSKMKQVIKSNDLDIKKYYQPILDMKMKLFPHILLNMVIMGATFIIGGGVHTKVISVNTHSLCFFISITHYLFVIIFQHRCFIRNTELVILVSDLVSDN